MNKFLLATISILFLVGCEDSLSPVTRVDVRTVDVNRPTPIVPRVDQLRLREVNWVVITPENFEERMRQISGHKVLFAITSDGYQNLSLNLSDVRALIEQQRRIIAIYERQFGDTEASR
jgi:hypothetical protein